MAGYVYVQSEPHLWTVGFYDPEGIWQPDSDQPSKEEAANTVTIEGLPNVCHPGVEQQKMNIRRLYEMLSK